jgi:hypothetical protein
MISLAPEEAKTKTHMATIRAKGRCEFLGGTAIA